MNLNKIKEQNNDDVIDKLQENINKAKAKLTSIRNINSHIAEVEIKIVKLTKKRKHREEIIEKNKKRKIA